MRETRFKPSVSIASTFGDGKDHRGIGEFQSQKGS